MNITKHQKCCVLIFVVASFLLLWKLDYAPFWNPDEGRYAAASMEMIAPLPGETSSWIIPHLNTLPRLNKPPLVYWTTATFYRLFGTHTWSARLTSAIASIGIMALLWWLALAIWGKAQGHRKAFFIMLVWATALLPFALSRILNTDMLLTFATTLMLIAIWRTAEDQPSWRAFAAAAIGLALALLAKGPVGLALPLLIVLVWLIMVKKKYFYRYFVEHKWSVLLAFIAGIGLAAPWYLAVNRERPGFLAHFILYENLGRFSGEKEYHDPSSPLFYLPVLLIGLFPWTLFLGTAAVNFWRERLQPTRETRARLFLWIWALLIVFFFSASSTKLITYILPALPAFAFLLGDAIAEFRLPQRSWQWAILLSAALAAIMGIVMLAAPYLKPILKLAPAATLQQALWGGGAILLLGAIGVWAAIKSPSWQLKIMGSAALLFTLFFPSAAGHFSPYEDISAIFIRLRSQLLPEDQIVEIRTFQPTVIFYAKRPVTVIDQPNTSGYNQHEFDTSPLFAKPLSAVYTMPAQKNRVFVLVKWREFPPGLRQLPLHYWAGNNDYALLSNRPAPAGWPIEFISPGKRSKIIPFPSHAN